MKEWRNENLASRLRANNWTVIYTCGERKNQFSPMECTERSNDSRVGHVFRNGCPIYNRLHSFFLLGFIWLQFGVFFFIIIVVACFAFLFFFLACVLFCFLEFFLLYWIFVCFLKKKLKDVWVGAERGLGRTHWKEDYNQYK